MNRASFDVQGGQVSVRPVGQKIALTVHQGQGAPYCITLDLTTDAAILAAGALEAAALTIRRSAVYQAMEAAKQGREVFHAMAGGDSGERPAAQSTQERIKAKRERNAAMLDQLTVGRVDVQAGANAVHYAAYDKRNIRAEPFIAVQPVQGFGECQQAGGSAEVVGLQQGRAEDEAESFAAGFEAGVECVVKVVAVHGSSVEVGMPL